MLRHTFIHAPGVTPTTEARLWRAGVHTWDDFLDFHRRGVLGGPRYEALRLLVLRSQSALRKRAVEFFSRRLPSTEHWRLYPDFAEQAAFVDIETTGLAPGYHQITIIGLYDGEHFRVFVRGKNLERFPEVVAHFPLLVTYNGSKFDLPFLRKEFRRFRPRAHLDLRWPLARLGYKGGLKRVERKAGICRPRRVRQLDGSDAVVLWNDYLRGRKSALDRLTEYARCDVMNLAPLANLVAEKMPRHLKFPGATKR